MSKLLDKVRDGTLPDPIATFLTLRLQELHHALGQVRWGRLDDFQDALDRTVGSIVRNADNLRSNTPSDVRERLKRLLEMGYRLVVLVEKAKALVAPVVKLLGGSEELPG